MRALVIAISIVCATPAAADDCIANAKYEQQRDDAAKKTRAAKDKALAAKKLVALNVKGELERGNRHDRGTSFDRDGKTYIAGPVELVRLGPKDVYAVAWSGKTTETRVMVCGCRPQLCELSGQDIYALPKDAVFKGELALEAESWIVWPFYLGGADCKPQDCPDVK